jgi:hypothetical protein
MIVLLKLESELTGCLQEASIEVLDWPTVRLKRQ